VTRTVTTPTLIGICGRVLSFSDEGRRDAFSSSQPYSRAIAKAGGLPVLLPPLATAPQMVHAFLDPPRRAAPAGRRRRRTGSIRAVPTTDSLYGMVGVHDEFDLALTHAAIERDVPILAVCRGMQILNVARGGTLIQDLDGGDHWMCHHTVKIVESSRLSAALGTSYLEHCYSVHHQGLDVLGDGVEPVAVRSVGPHRGGRAGGGVVDRRRAVAPGGHDERRTCTAADLRRARAARGRGDARLKTGGSLPARYGPRR
jgi:gamma-glutamyl-gamma-aminobutyrate hydrolase PuuD